MIEEVWKTVPEYPKYRVSSLGRVQGLSNGEWRDKKLKRVNKGANHGGREYLGFNVDAGEVLASGNRKKRTLLVHILVAELFIGPRPAGMNVLHRDDDRSNNQEDNIMYGTQSQNVKQAIANGKIKPVKGPDGKFRGSQ